MSFLSEELGKQLEAKGLTQLDVAKRSQISQGQISKWLRADQTSILEPQLTALAHAISSDVYDHASLVAAHLMDERFGAGSDLVEVSIKSPFELRDVDRKRSRTKREIAIAFLTDESLRNRDLNELLIDLARVLGAQL